MQVDVLAARNSGAASRSNLELDLESFQSMDIFFFAVWGCNYK